MVRFVRKEIVYADFECSTDGVHKAYCICWMNANGKDGFFYGENVAVRFLDAMNDGSLIYFHNLAYDINFIVNVLDKVCDDAIIRNGRVMSMTGLYHMKRLMFKDSYSIISKKLSISHPLNHYHHYHNNLKALCGRYLYIHQIIF